MELEKLFIRDRKRPDGADDHSWTKIVHDAPRPKEKPDNHDNVMKAGPN